MNRIEESKTEAIISEIRAAIDEAQSQRAIAVSISANELAREHGVHPNTVTSIIARMGLEWDGYAWYLKVGDE